MYGPGFAFTLNNGEVYAFVEVVTGGKAALFTHSIEPDQVLSLWLLGPVPSGAPCDELSEDGYGIIWRMFCAILQFSRCDMAAFIPDCAGVGKSFGTPEVIRAL